MQLPFPYHRIRIVSVRAEILRSRKKFDPSASENQIEDTEKEINTELDVWASKPNHIYMGRDGFMFRHKSDWILTHPLANIYKPVMQKHQEGLEPLQSGETVQNLKQKRGRKRGKRERSKSPIPSCSSSLAPQESLLPKLSVKATSKNQAKEIDYKTI